MAMRTAPLVPAGGTVASTGATTLPAASAKVAEQAPSQVSTTACSEVSVATETSVATTRPWLRTVTRYAMHSAESASTSASA